MCNRGGDPYELDIIDSMGGDGVTMGNPELEYRGGGLVERAEDNGLDTRCTDSARARCPPESARVRPPRLKCDVWPGRVTIEVDDEPGAPLHDSGRGATTAVGDDGMGAGGAGGEDGRGIVSTLDWRWRYTPS